MGLARITNTTKYYTNNEHQGLPLTFGVFQAYYSKHELFRDNEKQIPVIGATITGIAHAGFPIVSPIALRFHKYQLHMVWAGWFLCNLSIFLASFATNVYHLILTQGVLYGIGWVITYVPFLIMMNDWWVKKRGLIYGIVYGASGVGGLVLPYIFEALLPRFGFRITLRLTAVGMAILTGPGLLLIRQYPVQEQDTTSTVPKAGAIHALRNACKNRIFLLYAIASLLQGISFYIPRFYIPSFAHNIPLSNNAGATLLAIWSLFQIFGQMSLGALADKVSIFVPATLSTLASGLSAFFLWGPAKGFWPLAAFSAVYGAFSPAYSVMWSQTTRALGNTKEEAMMMFAVLSLGRGIGNELAGPVSAGLLGDTVDVASYGLGKYRGNVWFTGVTMLVASFTWLGWFWRHELDEGAEYREVKGADSEEGEERELDPLNAFEVGGSDDESAGEDGRRRFRS